MNKYSILKNMNNISSSSDDFFRSIDSIKALTPKAGISSLTASQNLNMTKSSMMILTPQSSFKFPEIYKISMPSDKDFSSLINKLDIVTSTRSVLNKDSALQEHEQLECVIEEGCYYYIKVHVKNKRSPLRVFMKRTQGKVLVYSSTLTQKPSSASHELIFSSDNFEIRNFESYFTVENVYLGIRALNDTRLTISLVFGKNRIHNFDEKKLKKKQSEDFDDFKEKKIRKKKPKRKKFCKSNIITENLTKRMLTPDMIIKRNKEWVVKREGVLTRRKYIIEEKKNRALNFINRAKIISELSEKEKIRISTEVSKKIEIKCCVTILYILKSSKILHDIRTNKRSQISNRIKSNMKVRTIQKFYRSTTKNLDKDKLFLLRCINLLGLYQQCARPILLYNTKYILFKFISNSGVALRPILKLENFIEKVQKIQKEYRKYLNIKSERKRRLILFWNECKAFQTRRSIKKKNQMYELNVSLYQRSQIIEMYYLECVGKFYESLRNSIPSPSSKIFISEVGDSKRQRLGFDYMPSGIIMRELIKKAVLVPDRQASDINMI
jgi:phage gp36-like protein